MRASSFGLVVLAVATPVEPDEHEAIVQSFIDDVGPAYEYFFSPVCDVAREGRINCFAMDGFSHVIVGASSRDDAPNYQWYVMEGDVSADDDPTDDTLTSDAVSFDGLDPTDVGRAFLFVEANFPDAPDPAYLVWSAVTNCNPDEMPDIELMVLLSMDDGRMADLHRSVCPERVEALGF